MPLVYDGKREHDGCDRRIAVIAAKQHGVFSRSQAVRCGATEAAIRWRVEIGRWHRVHPKVYRLAGAPPTWRQRALAACLHLGSRCVISHSAAARLEGLDKFGRSLVEVTVKNNGRVRLNGIKIHYVREPIPPEDITTIDGIPVTKPARTLLDLATVGAEDVIERCLDDSLRRRSMSLPFLERWLADPRRRRHRGAAMLRRLVEDRATIGVTESPLEGIVLKRLRRAGLPIPMLQYVVKDGNRFVARVDFAYPAERIAIEVDGFRYHDNRRSFDEERARGNRLEAMGWRVLRITAKHMEEDPDAVVVWVAGALGTITTNLRESLPTWS